MCQIATTISFPVHVVVLFHVVARSLPGEFAPISYFTRYQLTFLIIREVCARVLQPHQERYATSTIVFFMTLNFST